MNMQHASTDESKSLEQAWHDNWFLQNGKQEFPESPDEFRERFSRVNLSRFCDGGWAYWGDARVDMMKIIGDVRGLTVLDYGCGSGQLGIYLAMQGANISGFDLSPAGVELANWASGKYGLNCSFRALDAEEIDYPDQSFDLIVGFGVLHHVIKYPKAAAQMARVLKPGARAIFHETLWDNPLINLARRFTMESSDAGDAHLTASGLKEFGAPFARTEVRQQNILYMLKRFASLPARNLSNPLVPRPFWRGVRSIDQGLMHMGLSKYCGEAVVSYTK